MQYARHVVLKWQYYNQNDLYADILKYSNMGFTGMFSVETVLKIVAYGVKVSTLTLFDKKNIRQGNTLTLQMYSFCY